MWEVAMIGILLNWPNLELDRLHMLVLRLGCADICYDGCKVQF